MFERASKKLGLNQAIFLSGNFSRTNQDQGSYEELKKLSPEEIELLLKKGVLGLIKDQGDQKEDEDID